MSIIKNQFSIKDLEVLSGIKAHTIRIWEQRYGILKPNRTDTNIRFYSNDDLKLLLNITFLYNSGFKISKIARMAVDEINMKVMDICDVNTEFSSQINDLTIAMIEMDESKFDKIINRCVLQFGFEKMMEQVIYPFLEKVGIMWVTNNVHPAQEHFITNLIRQKIVVAIDGQTINESEDEKYLLFLPEEEIHEISLLYLNYLLRARKKSVMYLGISVPIEDLKAIYQTYHPKYLFTILTAALAPEDVTGYISNLSGLFPNATIYLSGAQVKEYTDKLPDNVYILKDLNKVHKYLNNQVASIH